MLSPCSRACRAPSVADRACSLHPVARGGQQLLHSCNDVLAIGELPKGVQLGMDAGQQQLALDVAAHLQRLLNNKIACSDTSGP